MNIFGRLWAAIENSGKRQHQPPTPRKPPPADDDQAEPHLGRLLRTFPEPDHELIEVTTLGSAEREFVSGREFSVDDKNRLASAIAAAAWRGLLTPKQAVAKLRALFARGALAILLTGGGAVGLTLAAAPAAAWEVDRNPQTSIEIWHDGLNITPSMCSYYVSGLHEIHVRAFYLHENPKGYRWIARKTLIVDSKTIEPGGQGHPVAFEVWTRDLRPISPFPDWRLVKICYDVPDPIFPFIFADGFERGSTDSWARTVPSG